MAPAAGVFSGDPVLAEVERLLAGVDQLCAASPVVLVAEDLQWADETSVLVWTRLCRAAGQMPLLLAGSLRPEAGRDDLRRLRRGVAARGGSVMTLGPLLDAEVAELAEGLLGGRPSRPLASVVERAGGNPLYVRELADGLVRQGRVAVADGIAELANDPAVVRVPESLAAAIGDRLDGLADEVVAALRWAAVLGAEFSVRDLEVVSGRSAGELMGVIDVAVGAGVVAEIGPRLGFRHGLVRQVLCEGMPAGLRTALHAQAARALAEADAPPGRVAVHLAEAQDAPVTGTGAEPWIVQWLAANAPALTYQAPAVTAELLRDVLARLREDDPRREDLQASLVSVAFQLLRHDEVEEAGRSLLASTRNPDRAAEMTWLIGYTQMRTGRTADAGATIQAGLSRPAISQSWRARLTTLRAIVQLIPGSSGLTERDAQDERVTADAIAVAERSGDRLALGYAWHAQSLSALVARDHAGVLEHTGRGLAVIGDDPQATGLRMLMLTNRINAIGRRDRTEAIATARRAVVLGEKAGAVQLDLVRCVLADQHFYTGQWDDALAEIEPATGLRHPNSFIQIIAHGMIALIAAHREDWHTAHEHLRGLPERLAIRPLLGNCVYLLLARALVAEKEGGPARAAEILAAALDPDLAPDMDNRYELLASLTRYALEVGDEAVAMAAAVAAQEEAARAPLAVKAAAADHCRGLVAGDPGAVLAAADQYQAAGVALDRAAALEDAAVLAARSGDRVTARQALAGAVGQYQALGAGWDIRRARSLLRSYGIRQGRGAPRARPASGWEALSPTEVKVASLVADGRSNPEIAAAMYLSRNTVQTHMSHILAKLGARSRAEVIRQALAHSTFPDLARA
jgi:DNA-binding CsgD family transcriptional regulator